MNLIPSIAPQGGVNFNMPIIIMSFHGFHDSEVSREVVYDYLLLYPLTRRDGVIGVLCRCGVRPELRPRTLYSRQSNIQALPYQPCRVWRAREIRKPLERVERYIEGGRLNASGLLANCRRSTVCSPFYLHQSAMRIKSSIAVQILNSPQSLDLVWPRRTRNSSV
ncbi:hypothetical protein RRG08_008798 [Elysia crispata]|uniref:Uncharacterized protein n=1 Tax=Elysia crispata TaxID=231223 RepID=A0AAE0Z8L0_9GAST|nr:hypothetical protein RRG08_008798 [Elysia crispata]